MNSKHVNTDSYFEWECIAKNTCIMKYEFTEVNRNFAFFSNLSFCRDGRAEEEGVIVRNHLICIGFNSSEIGHEKVLWQKQPNCLTFEVTYQYYLLWPKQQISPAAAVLPLCHVTSHVLLFLFIYTLSSSQFAICLPSCCVLGCKCKSWLYLFSFARSCDGAGDGAASYCRIMTHRVPNLFFWF